MVVAVNRLGGRVAGWSGGGGGGTSQRIVNCAIRSNAISGGTAPIKASKASKATLIRVISNLTFEDQVDVGGHAIVAAISSERFAVVKTFELCEVPLLKKREARRGGKREKKGKKGKEK